jgi:hypothetical protein
MISSMMLLQRWWLFTLVLSGTAVPGSSAARAGSPNGKELHLKMTMPEKGTIAADAYLCAAFRPPSDARSIVRIVPHASQDAVHHMLLLGARRLSFLAHPEKWLCVHLQCCAAPLVRLEQSVLLAASHHTATMRPARSH